MIIILLFFIIIQADDEDGRDGEENAESEDAEDASESTPEDDRHGSGARSGARSSSSTAQETRHDVDTHRMIVYIYVSYVYVYDKCLGRIYICMTLRRICICDVI